MGLVRGYLLVVGVLFYLPFGALLLVDPAGMFARMGMPLGSAMAIEEVRASHGGVWVLTGLLCIAAVWCRRWIRYVLVFLLILNGGFAIGRLVSLAIGAVPVMQIVPLLGVDLVLLLISIGALTKVEFPQGKD